MSEIKLPEPTAYRLTNTAFRTPVFEYHTTKERAENRQADFNRSVDDGGLHNLTELFTADQLRAAVELDRAGCAPDSWADAYAAFVGAFDTPQARRLDSSEYAHDARRRLREINEQFALRDAEQQAQRRPLTVFTYLNQPTDNVDAYRLGEACRKAADARAGDYIDRGLGLLKELQEKGYGVVRIGEQAQEVEHGNS